MSELKMINGKTLRMLSTVTFGLTVIFLGFSYFFSDGFFGSICSADPVCFFSGINSLPFFLHRILAVVLLAWLVYYLHFIWLYYRTDHLLLNLGTILVVLYFFQVLLGLAYVFGQPTTTAGPVMHDITAWLILIDVAGLVVVATKAGEPTLNHPELDLRERFFDVVMLTKPVIVLLLLFTTLAGMFFGAKSVPPLNLIVLTLVGGALAAGGSGAINQYLDRDLDREMQRTAKRPLPSGRIYPAEALAIGIAFCIISLYMFFAFVNLLSAALTFAGMVYYVYFYSVLLKKATVQNIVIGGGAGALPAVIGWAAVTGEISWASVILFLIVFMWTPPHFWALAIVRQKDYAKVNIPMLPVIKGELETRRAILLYSLVLVATTLLLPLLNFAGTIYLISALVLGAGFIFLAIRVLVIPGNKLAWVLYKYSSYYLFLIFLAVIFDSVF